MLGEPDAEQLVEFVESGSLDGVGTPDKPLPYNPAVMEQLAKTWEFSQHGL